MYIIDTHAHYDDEQFDADRAELLNGMKEKGVGIVVNAGASLITTKNGLALAKEYPSVYCMAGVHPDEVGELEAGGFDELVQLAKSSEKIVAIGEIGLDYHWMVQPKEIQQKWFARQMDLARELKLPINIHSRDAAEDTYSVMKQNHMEEIGGIIHCFSGSPEMADKYLEAGFYFGIGGVVTFSNAKKLKNVVRMAPVERLVLETDCPYLAPEPDRGKRNDSSKLIHVAEAIAELKGMTAEEVIGITARNAATVYRLPQSIIG